MHIRRMKTTFLITLIFVTLQGTLAAQQASAAYQQFSQQADSLMAQNQYLPAARKYSEAFASFGWKGYVTQRYNAARCWALAGFVDSAFFQLDRIASKANYSDFKALETEVAFETLRTDGRWPDLVKQVKKNSGVNEATFDSALYRLIDSLSKEDQKWRHASRELNNSKPVDSVRLAEAYRNMMLADSLNHLALVVIVEKHGFPDADLLGSEGTHLFWLLMQHQDAHPDFQQQVLALMEKAVQQGKASGQDYAYLLDRVSLNMGKLQVYGTQMNLNADGSSFEPRPCIDPEHLDERRASVGLGTIAQYIEVMNQAYSGQLKRKN
jgi:hypothetical protein